MDIGVSDYTIVSNTPTDEFNNFTGQNNDTNISELRSMINQDIISLEDNVNKDLVVKDSKLQNGEIEAQVRDIFDQMSKKYHVDIGYDNFRDMLKDISNYSKQKKEMMDAIIAKVTTSLTQRTNLKITIALSKLIERLITTVELSVDSEEQLNLDLVVNTIDRCMMWWNQLNEMVNQLKISDPDKKLTLMSNEINNNNNANQNQNTGKNISLINSILQQLNSEEK